MPPLKAFANNGHTILLGDALDALDNNVPGSSVDLVFADPPYNIGKQFGEFHDKWGSDQEYLDWCYAWLTKCFQKLKPSGSLYLMTSTQAMPQLDVFVRDHMRVLSRIVWHYDSSGVQARKYFGSMYEPILHAVRDSRRYTFNADAIAVAAPTGAVRKLIDHRGASPARYNSTKIPGNVWYFPRVRYRMDEYEDHPSQKPEALLERIIRASSNSGDVVLDPFAGTFTSCAVARKLGRLSIGIELSRDYCKVGLRRMGIASELDGEDLAPPAKTYVRRNGSKTGRDSYESSQELFSDK